MSVGFTKNKADIDNKAGAIALDLRNLMDRIEVFKTTLDTLTDVELLALPGTNGGASWVQAEVDRLRSAAGDWNQLRTIYEGTVNLSVAKDFRTFSKTLTGMN